MARAIRRLKKTENYIKMKEGHCCFGVTEKKAYIFNLYVKEKYRKKGVATKLIHFAKTEIFKIIRDKCLDIIFIDIVAEPSFGNITVEELTWFYSKQGLRVNKR